MTTAQEMLDAYTAAELSVLQGKRVRFNDGATDRWVDKEDLQWIQAGRREWQGRVNAASLGARRAPTIGGLGFSVARFD